MKTRIVVSITCGQLTWEFHPPKSMGLKEVGQKLRDQVEKAALLAALAHNDGVIASAAKDLDCSREWAYRMVDKHRLNVELAKLRAAAKEIRQRQHAQRRARRRTQRRSK